MTDMTDEPIRSEESLRRMSDDRRHQIQQQRKAVEELMKPTPEQIEKEAALMKQKAMEANNRRRQQEAELLGQTLVTNAQEQAAERWTAGIADFFRRVNSTIGGREVPFVWNDDEYRPFGLSQDEWLKQTPIAYTDGESVFISKEHFKDAVNSVARGTSSIADQAGVVGRLKGAAYHELAHVLYTPRLHAQPTSSIKDMAQTDSTIFRAYNVLEDQRIETRFGARYRSAIPHFTSMILQYIFSEKLLAENPGLVFPLVYGRRFMGADVLKSAEAAFRNWLNEQNGLNEKIADDIKVLIDEYRTLVYPRDWKDGVRIVSEFNLILQAIEVKMPQQPGSSPSPYGNVTSGDHEKHKKGTPVRTAQQDEDVEIAEEFAEDNDPNADSDSDGERSGSDTATGDKGSSGKEDGNKSNPSEDDANGEGSGDSDQPASNPSKSKSNKPGSGVGSGEDAEGSNADKNHDIHAELTKMLKSVAELNDKTIDGDAFDSLKSIRRAMDTARNKQKPNLRGAEKHEVSGQMRNSASQIVDAFNTIRAEGDAVWLSGQATGRLNTALLMNSRGSHLDVFNQWADAGDDATSMEVVILVDQSSSMYGYKQSAVSQGLWIIRQACEKLEIPVTAIGYNDYCHLLFAPETPVGMSQYHELNANGGTDPTDALKWVDQIFSTSQAANKILFSLTDGEWGMSVVQLKAIMRSIRSRGVHTNLIIQGEPRYQQSDVFVYPSLTGSEFYHDRILKCGDSAREFPKIVANAIKSIAAEVVEASK